MTVGKEKELWKDIKDYEGLYQASNLGRIKSLIGWNGKEYVHREKILKPTITDRRYASVTLHKNKRSKSVMIHRIIAEIFVDNSYNFPYVMHIDENMYNNKASNLKWGSAKENCNFPLHKEKQSKSMSSKKGELNNFYEKKHTDETKRKISKKRTGIYIKGKIQELKRLNMMG